MFPDCRRFYPVARYSLTLPPGRNGGTASEREAPAFAIVRRTEEKRARNLLLYARLPRRFFPSTVFVPAIRTKRRSFPLRLSFPFRQIPAPSVKFFELFFESLSDLSGLSFTSFTEEKIYGKHQRRPPRRISGGEAFVRTYSAFLGQRYARSCTFPKSSAAFSPLVSPANRLSFTDSFPQRYPTIPPAFFTAETLPSARQPTIET